MMVRMIAFVFANLLLAACAAQTSNYRAPPLKPLIADCDKSENCYLFDGSSRKQVIASPEIVVEDFRNLCLADSSIIETVQDERSTHSGMLFADCKKQGKRVANITLWYFPDGRYDLTLENCTVSDCGERYRPI